jgi:hypothetical protein
MRSAENRIVRPTAAGMKRVEPTAPGLATKTTRSGRCNGVGPAQRVASDVRSFTDPDRRELATANSSYPPYSPLAWAGLTTVAMLALSSLTAAHDRVPEPPPAFPAELITTGGSTAAVPKLASVSLSGTSAILSRGAGLKLFFGFVEFDWDPDASGGVPGFDSWPAFHNAVGVASR